MAFYENQSDMFKQRAEKCKRDGDRLYAQAMEAKDRGDKEKHKELMAQAAITTELIEIISGVEALK